MQEQNNNTQESPGAGARRFDKIDLIPLAAALLLAFAAKAQATTVPAPPSMDAAGTSISMPQAGNSRTSVRVLPAAAATPRR